MKIGRRLLAFPFVIVVCASSASAGDYSVKETVDEIQIFRKTTLKGSYHLIAEVGRRTD